MRMFADLKIEILELGQASRSKGRGGNGGGCIQKGGIFPPIVSPLFGVESFSRFHLEQTSERWAGLGLFG